MAWGGLTETQQILVKLYMTGGPQYQAQMIKAGLATRALAANNKELQAALAGTTQRSFLMNQGLFTARRLLLYTTLGTLGLVAATVKLGFSYDSAMQQATVALTSVIKPQKALNAELGELYRIAALTPFQFKDVTIAFRQMYAGFRPLNISAKTTNDTIQAISDALSYTGKVTPQALNRVSVALQHMAYMGRPAGQTIIQLARDGLPIYAALQKELGLTADQMKSIGSTGITAIDTINALNKYIETTPGFMNAAFKQSTQTLYGAATTFKDLLSQAAGGAVGTSHSGIFGFIQQTLVGVDKQLAVFYRHDKPITLENIAKAFDNQVSPATHAVLNTFLFMQGALQGLIFDFKVLFGIVNTILYPFNELSKSIGGTGDAAKYLGYFFGILIGLWITGKVAALSLGFAVDLLRVSFIGLKGAIIIINALLFIQDALMTGNIIGRWTAWAFAVRGAGKTAVLASDGMYKATGALAVMSRAILGAELLTIGWIGALVILSALLVILYFKWQKFHDIVNSTASYFWNHQWVQLFIDAFAPFAIVVTMFQHFYNVLLGIKKEFTSGGSWLKKGLGIGGDILSLGPGIPIPAIPHFAGGGVMPRTGWAMVGERGPEVVRLPAGAQVMPNTQQVSSVGSYGGSGGDGTPIVVQVVLDRKIVAQAVARANEDHRARR